jgi:hypothetical protein
MLAPHPIERRNSDGSMSPLCAMMEATCRERALSTSSSSASLKSLKAVKSGKGKSKSRRDLADSPSSSRKRNRSKGLDEQIVRKMLLNEKTKEDVQREKGFSSNYIMTLQRKLLEEREDLQLRAPEKHKLGNHDIHVLFSSTDEALFIRKELFTALSMSGTSFSYWRKRSRVSEIDTSANFRLMNQCRSIFGGRATYTLYSAKSAIAILTAMQSSRQQHALANIGGLKAIIEPYF